MNKPKGQWYERFRPQNTKPNQPDPIVNTEKPKNHWRDRFRPKDAEGTQPIPPLQGQPTQTMPQQEYPSSNGDAPDHPGPINVPWKSIIAAFLAFLLGLGMASCGDSDPKESGAYKDLDAKYSRTDTELTSTRDELDQTKDDLKTAKKKADKWDKEQEEKKAAEKKAADEKAAQEKAEQEKAAQEKAAQEKAEQEQAAQQAQQAQQQSEQQARAQAPAPAPAPAPDTYEYYPNCTAVRAAGKAPLYANQPGYRPALDRDHDGVACE